MACVLCARKVSKVQSNPNCNALEALTDQDINEDVRECFEKLFKVYEKNFGKQKKEDGGKHNKENEDE